MKSRGDFEMKKSRGDLKMKSHGDHKQEESHGDNISKKFLEEYKTSTDRVPTKKISTDRVHKKKNMRQCAMRTYNAQNQIRKCAMRTHKTNRKGAREHRYACTNSVTRDVELASEQVLKIILMREYAMRTYSVIKILQFVRECWNTGYSISNRNIHNILHARTVQEEQARVRRVLVRIMYGTKNNMYYVYTVVCRIYFVRIMMSQPLYGLYSTVE
jgi:hypothetical protein